jgi:hypothetical protein
LGAAVAVAVAVGPLRSFWAIAAIRPHASVSWSGRGDADHRDGPERDDGDGRGAGLDEPFVLTAAPP